MPNNPNQIDSHEDVIITERTRVPLIDALHLQLVDDLESLAENLRQDGNSVATVNRLLTPPSSHSLYI